MKQKNFLDKVANFFNTKKEWWSQAISGLLEFTFLIRHYDLAPDVMIFTTRFPPGFPNGRQLADDVNAIVCTTGDCLLQELSFIEAPMAARHQERQGVSRRLALSRRAVAGHTGKGNHAKHLALSVAGAGVTAFLIWGLVEIFLWLVRWLWRVIRRKYAEWCPA